MSALHPTVLIINAEPQVRRYLQSAMTAAGYRTASIDTAAMSLDILGPRPPHAMVLDLDVSDPGAKELLAGARRTFQGPIIVVSSSTREIERIDALDLGADAFFAKPFSAGELLARLRVAFRQRIESKGGKPVVKALDVVIDLINRTVSLQEQAIPLTAPQYQILARLAEGCGGVLTHQDLVAGEDTDGGARSPQNVRFLVRQLRQKLERDPYNPRVIKTDRGVGYRLIISPQ